MACTRGCCSSSPLSHKAALPTPCGASRAWCLCSGECHGDAGKAGLDWDASTHRVLPSSTSREQHPMAGCSRCHGLEDGFKLLTFLCSTHEQHRPGSLIWKWFTGITKPIFFFLLVFWPFFFLSFPFFLASALAALGNFRRRDGTRGLKREFGGQGLDFWSSLNGSFGFLRDALAYDTVSPVNWLLLHYSIDTILCMLVSYFYTVAWNLLTYTVDVLYSYDKIVFKTQFFKGLVFFSGFLIYFLSFPLPPFLFPSFSFPGGTVCSIPIVIVTNWSVLGVALVTCDSIGFYFVLKTATKKKPQKKKDKKKSKKKTPVLA